ncbi:MAG: DUF429 domain-containing protein [Haloquadratum sp.]|jgi:hypothetical protein|nr:DUF429 domain-containing protein [Haloferacaceae archaeon]MDR9444619.1 DUF429 domain-containing protein [Haloquadratum sp.]
MTTRVWGIDFSGAAHPGARLALAEATLQEGVVRIGAVEAVATRCGTPSAREAAIAGLTELARSVGPDRVGIDAALSLPQTALRALGADRWQQLPAAVRRRCPDARALTGLVIDAAPPTGPRYPRRVTDARTAALSPVHFMIAAQTYAALTELLPRWRAVGDVAPHGGARPTLCEVYPAAALSVWAIASTGYKGEDPRHRDRRVAIIDALTDTGAVTVAPGPRAAMLDQPGGDLLDAAIAAVVAGLARPTAPPGPPAEGAICGGEPTDYRPQCPLLPT